MSNPERADRNGPEAIAILIARHSTQLSAWDMLGNRALAIAGLAVGIIGVLLAGLSSRHGHLEAWDWSLLGVTALLFGCTVWPCLLINFSTAVKVLPIPADVIAGLKRADATEIWCKAIADAIELNREPLRIRGLRTNFAIVLLCCEATAGFGAATAGLAV